MGFFTKSPEKLKAEKRIYEDQLKDLKKERVKIKEKRDASQPAIRIGGVAGGQTGPAEMYEYEQWNKKLIAIDVKIDNVKKKIADKKRRLAK